MGEIEDNLRKLTDREIDVLEQILINHKIEVRALARLMGNSVGTIQAHKTNINKKLKVPPGIHDDKKREWVVENYAQAFEKMFNRGVLSSETEPLKEPLPSEPENVVREEAPQAQEPPKGKREIFIKPEDPVLIIPTTQTEKNQPKPPSIKEIPRRNQPRTSDPFNELSDEQLGCYFMIVVLLAIIIIGLMTGLIKIII